MGLDVDVEGLSEVDPTEICSQRFPELLLLRFDYAKGDSLVVQVADVVRGRIAGTRGFGALHLQGAHSFVRGEITSPRFKETRDSYVIGVGGVAVKQIRYTATARVVIFRLESWNGFGWLGAEGSQLRAFARWGASHEVAGETLYRDSRTGHALDFRLPFPELLPGASP